MTVFRNYVRRITARPWMILMTVAIPSLIVLVVSAGGGGNRIRVALFDHDNSFLSEMVREALSPVAVLVDIDQDDIETALVDGRIELALVLPSGMQSDVVAGERAVVRTYSLQAVQMTRLVTSAASVVLSAAHNVAVHVDHDADRFERVMRRVQDGPFLLNPESFRSERGALTASEVAEASQLIGMLTLTMLVTAAGVCITFLKDVEAGTYHRTIAGPTSLRRYMAETVAAFYGVTAIQAIAAAVALRIVVPKLTPVAFLMIVAVLASFALVAVSMALAVANTMKTVKRTAITTNFLVVPIVMLGGGFWPFDIMPDYLQRIGAFSPTRWTTLATTSVLSGASFVDIAPHLGLLLLSGIVFGLLGSWRRIDVTI